MDRDRIVIAGGLRPAPGEWYCGGLWVLEVESREDAVKLCEDDPYFRQGAGVRAGRAVRGNERGRPERIRAGEVHPEGDRS